MSTVAAAGRPASGQGGYFAGLDGLRCVAFLLIFGHHVGQRFPTGNDWLDQCLRNAWCGVDLFLVLSGFLVTHILLGEARKYAAAGGPGNFSIAQFAVRRALRIAPLYFLALVVFLHVLPRLDPALTGVAPAGSAEHDATVATWGPSSWTFLLNWRILHKGRFPNWGVFDTVGPLWSVSMEVQFYCLWPLLLRLTPARHRLRLILVVAGLSFVAKVPVAYASSSYLAIYQNTFLRLDSFLCGALIAWAADRRGGEVPPAPRWAAWGTAAAAAAIFMLPGLSRRGPAETVAGYLLLDLAAAGAVWMCLTPSSVLCRVLRCQPFRWLGGISYGLYVFHALALSIVLSQIGSKTGAGLAIPERLGAAAAALAITVVLAAVSYHAFERWFLRVKPRSPAG